MILRDVSSGWILTSHNSEVRDEKRKVRVYQTDGGKLAFQGSCGAAPRSDERHKSHTFKDTYIDMKAGEIACWHTSTPCYFTTWNGLSQALLRFFTLRLPEDELAQSQERIDNFFLKLVNAGYQRGYVMEDCGRRHHLGIPVETKKGGGFYQSHYGIPGEVQPFLDIVTTRCSSAIDRGMEHHEAFTNQIIDEALSGLLLRVQRLKEEKAREIERLDKSVSLIENFLGGIGDDDQH